MLCNLYLYSYGDARINAKTYEKRTFQYLSGIYYKSRVLKISFSIKIFL